MKLSIITICYNNADGLRQTLTCTLRNQGEFRDFEQIVVDGGSTDNTLDVIHEFEEGLSWWCSEPDKGIYNAMNKGVEHASGEYLLFLNSGDLLLDRSLEQIFSTDFTEDLVYMDIYTSGGKDRILVKSPSDIELTPAYLTINTLPHQATLIRRELHNELGGYDERMKISAAPKFMIDAILGHHCTTRYLGGAYTVFDRSGISSVVKMLPTKLREWQYFLEPHFGVRVSQSFFRAKMSEKIVSMHVVNYAAAHPEKIAQLCQVFNDVTKNIKHGTYEEPQEYEKALARVFAEEKKNHGNGAFLQRRIAALEKEVEELKCSTAYRVGMFLTWPLRTLYHRIKGG